MTQAEYIMSMPVEMMEKFFGRPVEEVLENPGADDSGRDYAMGYSETFTEMLTRRSAGSNAQHLLPHLQAGMTLLDLGCGPGSITAGLAQAVHPGRVWGVDFNQEQLQQARGQADALGLENLRFLKADGLNLPFPDNSFDAVHCHGFLMHSTSIRQQMTEILRVLKPGGILASRDMDVPTSFIAPAVHGQNIFEMLAEVIRREGGDPWMGRRLKAFFLNGAGGGGDRRRPPDGPEFLLKWGPQAFMERTFFPRTPGWPGGGDRLQGTLTASPNRLGPSESWSSLPRSSSC